MKITEVISFIENKAKDKKARVVICEGWDERCILAAADVLEKEITDITLLGNPDEIKNIANNLKVNISNADIIDFKNSELKNELSDKLYELRKNKGLTLEKAKELINDENYFGCMYAYSGFADAVAGSAICPTANLMRPALQIMRENGKLVSETCITYHKDSDRVFLYSDANLNIRPNSQELSEIAINAADCASDLGLIPKVAMLSFSTKGSGGDHEEILKIREAIKLVREKRPDLLIDGEMQVDAAVNLLASQKKAPNSLIKGDANVLVFPDLTSANIFLHSMGQFAGMSFGFTMLKGLQKPVSLVGRSTPKETVRNVIVSLAMESKK